MYLFFYYGPISVNGRDKITRYMKQKVNSLCQLRKEKIEIKITRNRHSGGMTKADKKGEFEVS
jgi:hypothetical protein